MAAGLKDPTTATLPPGCVYSAAAHTVTCSGARGGLTIDGWNFGDAGGAGLCVRLLISGNVNGAIIIQNNLFKNSAQCNVANGSLVNFSSNAVASSVLVQNNVFDGNAQSLPYAPLPALLNISLTGGLAAAQAVTIQYNGFFRSVARGVQVSTSGLLREQFNYGEGFTFTPGQALHGEFNLDSRNPASDVVSSRYIGYNTLLQGKDAIGLKATTLAYATTGAAGVGKFGSFAVEKNTLISNRIGASNPVGYLIVASYDTFDAIQFKGNYMDANGAFWCIAYENPQPVFNSPPFFDGNINMQDGSTVNVTGPCYGSN